MTEDSNITRSPDPELLQYGSFKQKVELDRDTYDRVIEASGNVSSDDVARARQELVDKSRIPFDFPITDNMARVYHAFGEIVPNKRECPIWKRTEMLIYFGVIID